MFRRICSLLSFLLLGLSYSQAQQDSLGLETTFRLQVKEDILGLEVEGLKEKEIYSISGRSENFFSTPFPAEVLTGDEIRRSGALNIPEALRLVPGLLVRQKTNGNYDVHIRGLDYVAADRYLYESVNSITLVLVDGVPYNDHLRGGVFWETLPVSIGDIERIEVIKGVQQTLYGPSALTGIIHIITQKPLENGFHASANLQGGTNGTFVHDGSFSYKVNDKISFRLSGNYQFGERFQDDLFLLNEGRSIAADSLLFEKFEARRTNAKTELAIDRFGVNAYIFYNPNEDIQLETAFSTQNSLAQTVYWDDTLNLSNRDYQTNIFQLRGQAYDFNMNFSYSFGSQSSPQGYEVYQFDRDQVQFSLDYQYQYKKFRFQPGISLLHAALDDRAFIQNGSESALNLFNDKVSFTNLGVYLRAVWKPFEALNLTGSIRMDNFNVGIGSYASFQLASSYQINSLNVLRASYGKGNRSPFLRDYFNRSLQRFPDDGIIRQYVPSNDLSLLRLDNAEIGYRSEIIPNLEADFSFFYYQTQQYAREQFTEFEEGVDEVERVNTNLKARQIGATGELTAIISKLRLTGFITWQNTRLSNFPDSTGASSSSFDHEATPSLFGGMTLNYSTLLNRLNVFASLYFLGEQNLLTRYRPESIATRYLGNLKVSYRFWQSSEIYLNARNIFNQENKEFVYGDENGGLYLIGLRLKI